jgi:hypothetical protein
MVAVTDMSPASVFCKKVWDITPQPTPASVTIMKALIKNYTNPTGGLIVDGANKLLQKNYPALLEELVSRKILKKA